MANLVSPGVQVQLIDESFYASSGPGTVPFVMLATAANKSQPGNTTSVAPGTIAANANKLYLITSQRELLQTFGSPKFYTQAGTPQHGNELNEYGLYSAYQYLGLANRVWAMRADVDLNALQPTAIEPTGSATNGDHWLDLGNTAWGVFRSNGNINSSLAWGALAPIVINSAVQLEVIAQGVTATPVVDVNAALITTSADLVFNNLTVSLTNGWSLNQVVQAINAAVAASTSTTVKSLRAESYSRVQRVGVNTEDTVYNLRLVNTDAQGEISLVGSNATVLTNLGMTASPTNHAVPVSTLGTVGSVAVNAVKTTVSAADVQVFEKIAVTTQDGTDYRWFLVGSDDSECPGWSWASATPTVITGSSNNLVFAPDGQARITVGSTAADMTSTGVATATYVSGSGSDTILVTTASITNTIYVGMTFDGETVVSVSDDGTDTTVVMSGTVTAAGTLTFVDNGYSMSNFVADINAFFDDNGMNALASIVTSGPNSYLKITNYDGTQLGVVDKLGSPFTNAGVSVSQTYYGEVVGSAVSPTFVDGDLFTITVGGVTSNGINMGSGTANISSAITAINSSTVGTAGLIVASNVDNKLKISSTNNSFFTVTNVTGYDSPTPPLETAGIAAGTVFGNQLVYQGYTISVPQPRTADQVAAGNIWINTQAGNRGAAWSVKRYNAGTATWQARQAPLYLNDASANAGYGSQKTVGSIYVRYNSNTTDPTTAAFVVNYWTGTAWTSLDSLSTAYTQSYSEPTGAPAALTLWYNTDLVVDIMVSNGQQWMGYRNMYPATDPNGVILSATEPSTQSDFSALEDNDLWIDTSDLENYPKIYRYDSLNSAWLAVDNTDQSSSQGVVFADARNNADGTQSGSTDIQQMLISNYVDPDAPSALAYPVGLLLMNTRLSTNNVKQWRPNYLSTGAYKSRWVTVSGNASDGSPRMGRKAQRAMVVQAMAAALVSNQELRAEANFFNLLAAPGYPELIDEMVTLNTDKKDIAFVLVDPPARLPPTGTDVQAWANNSNNAASNGEAGLITRSRYAGVYYPWGLATNLDGGEILVPPSMAVLRTMAFNDQVSYPWFAPAGFNRGLVTAVASVGYLNGENEYVPVQLTQGQRDVLYENDINPIAFIPGRGLVVYGQKTLSPVDSAMNRVNVSRLVNYLNYNLDNLAKPFLFEPNDQYTRDSVQRTFESFLGDMVSLRAVYDFAVQCDENNNTPERIDRNELWIDIAIKPAKAIEFIYIPLRILNTGDTLPA
jgi:hypothetical protein